MEHQKSLVGIHSNIHRYEAIPSEPQDRLPQIIDNDKVKFIFNCLILDNPTSQHLNLSIILF